MDSKITLYDYLLWTADGDENNIDVYHIADQLVLEWDNDEIEAFYKKYKNSELMNFTERYTSPDETYRGLGYYDTVVSFSIDGMNFEVKEVNGSYLHDHKHLLPALPKEKMVEWAEQLQDEYSRANNTPEYSIRTKRLAELAEDMGTFIDEFLKVYKEK
jgi:hypothetical protein